MVGMIDMLCDLEALLSNLFIIYVCSDVFLLGLDNSCKPIPIAFELFSVPKMVQYNFK